ncbi:MAG: hypothetical protein AVDCRST_MAG59-976 [uncultured Thermomicrobiales bacterium]|uniref:Uncharacterized protein n=1 Tax=uncultured Thermomicrobiales bacterium TaxID=1645740 RepID=A0A6J4U9Y9_9BACT|nr:MAG: hypothetical protein AVDCRST_MAG59-976 [uncultured Thermomicrobiales bacterium]
MAASVPPVANGCRPVPPARPILLPPQSRIMERTIGAVAG